MHAIFQSDTSCHAGDCNFQGIHKMSPTTIHIMNKSTNTGDSLSGDSPNSTGRIFTAVRDALLDPSPGKNMQRIS